MERKMKIMLISPPDAALVYGKIGKRLPPAAPSLGLAYIAAVLEQNEIDVLLLDARGRNLGLDEIREEIEKYEPRIVGITCITPTFGISIKIAGLVKEVSPGIRLVMGGPHVTAAAVETLEKYPAVDIAVIGEGEYTMLDIARQKELEDINGIAFRRNGGVVVTERRPSVKDLNSLPYPSRHFFDLSNYHQPLHEVYGVPLTTILSSRGCPFDCNFCSSKITFGRTTRFRDSENVMKEIDYLIENFGVKGIKFADDTFTLNRSRLEILCREIKKRGIYWIGNARVDTLDRDLLVLMKESGCKMLLFGIETGDPGILRHLKKGTTLEQAKNVMKWANEIKLDTTATFIFGTPPETDETVNRTIEFAKELCPTYANFFILSPYPGTEIHEYMDKAGMMKINDWTEINSPKYENYIIKHPYFSEEQLRRIQRRGYKKFYYSWKHSWVMLTRLRSLQALKMYFKLAMTLVSFVRK